MAKKLRINKNQSYSIITIGLIVVFIVLLLLASFSYTSSLLSAVKSLPDSCLSNVSCMAGVEDTFMSYALVFSVVLVVLVLLCSICFVLLLGRARGISAKSSELMLLTNGIANGIVKMRKGDDSYCIQYANDGFYRLVGYSRKEYRSKYNNELFGCAYLNDIEGVKSLLQEYAGKEKITMEFRIINKFAQVRWLLMNAVRQEQNYLCSFTDITSYKAVEEELQLNNDRMHIVLDSMQDMLFEYNLLTNQIQPISNMETFECITDWRLLESSEAVSESDVHKLKSMVDYAREGRKYQSSRFRIKSKENTWIWCELSLTTLFDGMNRPCRVLGQLTNIDTQIREKEHLIEISQRDPMTSLLNKTVAQDRIEEFMASGGENGAMLLLDIDNFKQINDTYGHIHGDKVIKFFAMQLSKLFRQYDIVSRLGGDEFLIFMKYCNDVNLISEKAEEMKQLLSEFEIADQKNVLSFSMGIALYKRDGQTYHELLENADLAMYAGKRNGKGCYEFYCDEMKEHKQS